MEQLDQEEKKILQLLPKGIERPRPLKELVKLTGWNNRRVRGIINRLIVIHHQPIGARYEHPNNGYFIITNNKERQQALAPLTSQIAMMSKRAQAISNAELESEE
ncbi:hypothetical protein DKZ27_06260 [Limosilactobacillus reuteri]|uniref:hypothetical protein n=1 Tax=Limosilactobacillus reuteri TaxID=1598 RepID=UPI000D6F52B7|nr:hypothetical protein [Limosilactobacillus reuteri]PWT30511.1 hypothetical protein DKZ27_06260 [Limosilactobacillus reuteri]